MNLTARATVFVANNRILAYVLATLALSVYLIASFSPAAVAADGAPSGHPGSFFGSGTEGQPGFVSNTVDNCRYLTFCRWDNLAQTGQPPVIGLPVVFITNFLFALGQFVFFCIGQLFVIVESFDLYYRMIYFGDSLFAQVGTAILNPGSALFGIVIMGGLAVIALASVFPQFAAKLNKKQASKGHKHNIINTAMWSTIGVTIFFLMTTASAMNHPVNGSLPRGASSIAEASLRGASVDGKAADKSPVGRENATTALAKEPGQWKFFSLGWAISTANVAVNGLGDLVSVAIQSVSNKVTFSNPSAEASDCFKYIEGMHTLYSGPRAMDSEKGVFALENLYQKTMLNQYVQSTFGASKSANDAWCRVLELNQPVGDQVLIARTAGVYTAMTDTVMDPRTRDLAQKSQWTWREAPAPEMSSIKDNKNFEGKNYGAGWAVSLFAPPAVGDDYKSARVAHRMYFAACHSDGNQMVLNDEWTGAVPASAEGSRVLSSTWCQAVAKGESTDDTDNGTGTSGKAESVGFWYDATDGAGKDVSSSRWIEGFAYNNGQQDANILSILFAGGGKDLSPKFLATPGGLGGQAYLYYTTSSGIQYGAALLTSFIMLITVTLTGKIIIPLVAGGALAQLLGGFSLLALAISLIALMVWPSDKVKQLNMKIVGVAIGGSLVSSIFAAAFQIFAALFGLTTSIFYTAPNPMNFRIITTGNAVGLIMASIVSYYTMKLILKKTLNFDATNMKSAMSSAGKAVMAPMTGDHKTFRDAAASPFTSASNMLKMPDGDKAADTGWGKLRNAGATAASNTADLISKGRNKSEVSTKSPQGATSTKTGRSDGRKDGTMDDPIIGSVINPTGGTMGSAYGNKGAGSGSDSGNGAGSGTKLPNQIGTSTSSTLSDEQQRKRLLDQVKGLYGTADFDKVFPKGAPQDIEKTIGGMTIDQVNDIAKEINLRLDGSDKDRANPEEAQANLLRMREMGNAAAKENPSGFDPAVGYAERAATQANMFRNVRPVSEHDLSQLSETERASYNKRQFDSVGGMLPERHVVSFDGSAVGVKGGDVSHDALTGRSVPNAVVRSGSQNLGALEGVTGDGSVLYGTKRDEEGGSDWNVSTLNSGARQLPPSMLGAQVPPAGVRKEQWDDVQSMHEWIAENDMTADNTSISSWPQARQAQATRVAEIMGNVMKSQGVKTVNPENLGELASSAVGMAQSFDETFAFGSSSKSDFDPSVLRTAIAEGNAKIAELRKNSTERQGNMLSGNIDEKISLVEATLQSKESKLRQRLSEGMSLENQRAEAEFGGLITALETRNMELANEISELLNEGKWDEIADILGNVDGSEEGDDELYDRLRAAAEETNRRVEDLKREHRQNLEDLYETSGSERERIIRDMHRDIEEQLEDDIQREIDDAEDLAMSEAPEAVRQHVEGMMGWFPNVQSGKRRGGLLGKIDSALASTIRI
jgi:hypothetical protein